MSWRLAVVLGLMAGAAGGGPLVAPNGSTRLQGRVPAAALPAIDPIIALHAAADMVAHRFDPDSATELLVEAHSKGLRGVRLLDVSAAADHELQRRGGRTPAEALSHVRAMLPNVPAPEAAVTRHGT